MVTFIQKIKEILILSVFNVLLPSADVFSDFYQSGRLYVGYVYHPNLEWWCPDGDRWDNQISYACIEARRKHMDLRVIRFPGWAGLLIAPFLINYIYSLLDCLESPGKAEGTDVDCPTFWVLPTTHCGENHPPFMDATK